MQHLPKERPWSVFDFVMKGYLNSKREFSKVYEGIKAVEDDNEELEIKEHVEEGLDGVEERIDESELEEENLNTISEDELEDYDDGDEFFTNILDEDDISDDQIFTDLDAFESEDE